jgi:hypothetical protein
LRKPELIERLIEALALPPDASPRASSAPLVSSKNQPRAKSQSKKATPSLSTAVLSGRAFESHLPEQTEQPPSPEQATPIQPEHDQFDVAQAAAGKFFLGPQPEPLWRQDASSCLI